MRKNKEVPLEVKIRCEFRRAEALDAVRLLADICRDLERGVKSKNWTAADIVRCERLLTDELTDLLPHRIAS